MTDSRTIGTLTDWIAGQQLALGASLLAAKGSAAPNEQTLVFKPICRHPRAPDSAERVAYLARLQELPPAALEMLTGLPDAAVGHWHEHRPLWTDALDRLRWDGVRSPAAAANLIADRIVSGALTGKQIIRLARGELGAAYGWQTPGIEQALDRLIDAMRTARSSRQRVIALTAFRGGEVPSRWGMVENAIAQRVHSWPLLVLEGDQAVSCALPMSVEVLPGGRDGVVRQPVLVAGDGILCPEWNSSVARALRTACRLWAHKHASWNPAFQKVVAYASVDVDLHVASLIVRPYLEAFGRFRFEGGSLETYLALEMLNQILGSFSLGTICATGKLGDEIPNGRGRHRHYKGADRQVERLPDLPNAPNRVQEKIACARRAFFDHIIIREGSAPTGYRMHLKVTAGRIFSDFANQALGQDWRHHRYVRAPDLAHRFKQFKWQRPEGPEAEELWYAFDRIHASRDEIIELEDCSPVSVAQALYETNRTAETDPNFDLEGNERQANFAFVRAVSDETNEQFWRTIWDVIDGDAATHRKFCAAVGRRQAARILADQLNWLSPTWERRRRAPDVLVIAGARHLRFLRPHSKGRPGHLAPVPLLKTVYDEGLLRPPPNPAVRKHVGRTRIVLVDNDWLDRTAPPEAADPQFVAALKTLSIFRFGFTFAMARSLLNVDDAECDRILDGLSKEGERPAALYHAASAGEYCLDVRIAPGSRAAAESALHFNAARAIVGFLDRSVFPERLEFDQALRPDRLHEAKWHLREAASLAEQAGDIDLYRQSRDALDRLGPIAPPVKVERPPAKTPRVAAAFPQSQMECR